MGETLVVPCEQSLLRLIQEDRRGLCSQGTLVDTSCMIPIVYRYIDSYNAVYIYLHIALVYLLSTLIADEIFNSLYYYIIYIYLAEFLKTYLKMHQNIRTESWP